MNCWARSEPQGPEPVRTRTTGIDQGASQRRRVVRVSKKGGPAGCLRHGTDIGSDDWTRTGHRFEDRQPESLIERGIHEKVRGSIKASGFFKRHATDENNVVVDPEVGNESMELSSVLLVSFRADDDKFPPSELRARSLPGVEQSMAILVAPQGRDEQPKWLRNAVGGGDLCPSCGSIARFEHIVVDGLWNQPHLRGIYFQVLVDLAPKAVGIDDDGSGEPRRTLIGQPPIRSSPRAECCRCRKCVHGLDMNHQAPRGVEERGDTGVQHVDVAQRKSQRSEDMLAGRAQDPAFVGPRIRDVADGVSVVGMDSSRLRAEDQMEFFLRP